VLILNNLHTLAVILVKDLFLFLLFTINAATKQMFHISCDAIIQNCRHKSGLHIQIPSYSKHDNFKLLDARNTKENNNIVASWKYTLSMPKSRNEERQTATARYKFYIQKAEAIMNEEWEKISYAYA
jgi:hypothetical protein